MAVTVVLADDHQIVRQGLRSILGGMEEFEVVGEAADGLEAVREVERLAPAVLILDLMMPGLSGIEVARQVTQRQPAVRVVVLSMHNDPAYVARAFQAGASAYVLKEVGIEELVRAIREVVAGRQYVSPPLSAEAIAAATGPPAPDLYESLTPREREVMLLTAQGHTGAEISRQLFISPRTVETHRVNLMRKLGIRNQKELVRYAIERGLLRSGGANP